MEILTLKAFADRLSVGRTTVYEWMKKGILIEGEHFMKLDRIVRFFWCPGLLISLCQNNRKSSAPSCDSSGTASRSRSPGARPAVNLEY